MTKVIFQKLCNYCEMINCVTCYDKLLVARFEAWEIFLRFFFACNIWSITDMICRFLIDPSNFACKLPHCKKPPFFLHHPQCFPSIFLFSRSKSLKEHINLQLNDICLQRLLHFSTRFYSILCQISCQYWQKINTSSYFEPFLQNQHIFLEEKVLVRLSIILFHSIKIN